ncbi:MAG: AEC family transporter [Oscillospiraceae bacterium]|nr:AEC family transporter [Oscillospiraceae bacterium]
MLGSLLVALRVVLPMAITMGVGSFVRAAGVVRREDMGPLNRLIFKVLMPCLLFKNIYNIDFSANSYPKELACIIVGMLVVFAFAVVVPRYLVKDPKQAASVGQAVFRCNYVLFGVAVTESIYGAGNAGLTALLGSIVVPGTSALSVVLLEMARNQKASVKQLARSVLSNPLVISAILALSIKLLDINLPEVVVSVVESLAGTATAISFLSLGVSLNVGELRNNRYPMLVGVILRMILLPLLFLPVVVALGFRRESLCALMIFFSSPTAISSYPMAVAMDADGSLAGQLVCITTLVSVVTMFALVFLLKNLGLL